MDEGAPLYGKHQITPNPAQRRMSPKLAGQIIVNSGGSGGGNNG